MTKGYERGQSRAGDQSGIPTDRAIAGVRRRPAQWQPTRVTSCDATASSTYTRQPAADRRGARGVGQWLAPAPVRAHLGAAKELYGLGQ